MYSNDDIQEMIDRILTDKLFAREFEKQLNQTNAMDKIAITAVLNEGYYETFDRYDSDVCEQFIEMYESANNELEGHSHTDNFVMNALEEMDK